MHERKRKDIGHIVALYLFFFIFLDVFIRFSVRIFFIYLYQEKNFQMNIDIFKDLNDSQQEAVRSTEGRVRVVAGAGAGKRCIPPQKFRVRRRLHIPEADSTPVFAGGDHWRRRVPLYVL